MASHLAVGGELEVSGAWYRRRRICAARPQCLGGAGQFVRRIEIDEQARLRVEANTVYSNRKRV
jgi:hypothetical protein